MFLASPSQLQIRSPYISSRWIYSVSNFGFHGNATTKKDKRVTRTHIHASKEASKSNA